MDKVNLEAKILPEIIEILGKTEYSEMATRLQETLDSKPGILFIPFVYDPQADRPALKAVLRIGSEIRDRFFSGRVRK